MLEGTLLAELNQQIKYELYSAQLYLAMAAYCHSVDQEGFANFLEVQVEEEETFLGIVNKLKEIMADSALAQLDAELAQRSFKPPHK